MWSQDFKILIGICKIKFGVQNFPWGINCESILQMFRSLQSKFGVKIQLGVYNFDRQEGFLYIKYKIMNMIRNGST